MLVAFAVFLVVAAIVLSVWTVRPATVDEQSLRVARDTGAKTSDGKHTHDFTVDTSQYHPMSPADQLQDLIAINYGECAEILNQIDFALDIANCDTKRDALAAIRDVKYILENLTRDAILALSYVEKAQGVVNPKMDGLWRMENYKFSDILKLLAEQPDRLTKAYSDILWLAKALWDNAILNVKSRDYQQLTKDLYDAQPVDEIGVEDYEALSEAESRESLDTDLLVQKYDQENLSKHYKATGKMIPEHEALVSAVDKTNYNLQRAY
jgi:hypothetical protein